MRLRDQIEVRELLNLTILGSDPCKGSWPNPATVSRTTKVRNHVGERSVQGVGINADDLHALLDQPQSRFATEPRLPEILLRVDPLIAASLDHRDVERLELIVDALQFGLQVGDGDLVTGLLVSHVEDDAGSKAPFERHFTSSMRLAGSPAAVRP